MGKAISEHFPIHFSKEIVSTISVVVTMALA
jgi:hypothetical protein